LNLTDRLLKGEKGLGKKELTYFIGGTIGAIVGFILAKVYQIWAILYETEGLVLEGVTGWEGKPLWKTVNENPGTTTFLGAILFLGVGLLFSYFVTAAKNK
jgi:hypothetical protein